jgi:enoyl-CoA hydratase
MKLKHVEIERSDRVAIVRFDRGDSLNALSMEIMSELLQVAHSFEDDTTTTAVVLTGSGTTFSAGIDLRDPELMDAMTAPLGRRRRLLSIGPRMCRAWEAIEQITIAAIEGHCVGGGVALAVSCDFRIVGRNSFCRVPELNLGMNMSWQSLPRIVHLVGPARAKQIVILGEKIDSESALNWGLAQDVANDGDVLNRAIDLAERVAAMPPLPVKMTKEAINAITNALDNTASYMDTDQFMLCQMSEDHSEAVSAFLQKRKPSFKGS